jgi:unsaturated chondroitin disaccharide hydrolase
LSRCRLLLRHAGLLANVVLPVALAGTLLHARPAEAEDPFDARVRSVWPLAQYKADRTARDTPADRYPMVTLRSSGRWHLTRASMWTSGFWPGSLWAMYQETADPVWQWRARAWQAGIAAYRSQRTIDRVGHDIGFMFLLSYAAGYRLTGVDGWRRWAVQAAESLATRYNPRVRAIRSWGRNALTTEFKVIIDNMMNLELLLWAARHGGRRALRNLAVQHALTCARWHVRPDGSTYHVVNFDPRTGKVLWRRTSQGYQDWSTWSRGQAWGLYGFTVAYRETADRRFLNFARRLAGYYLTHLPADRVPYWDFQAPNIPKEPKDSSAAAIAASGLLELARLETDRVRRHRWFTGARRILTALTSPTYLDRRGRTRAILLHGTGSRPTGDYDRGLVYGDYYLLEALQRLRWFPPPRRPLPVRSVSSSKQQGGATARRTLDGRLDTFWSARGLAWLRYDLGAARRVGAVSIAWHAGRTRTTGFDLQTSVDGRRWQRAKRAMSSATTATAETYRFGPRTARHVRIISRGDVRTRTTAITEVDMY